MLIPTMSDKLPDTGGQSSSSSSRIRSKPSWATLPWSVVQLLVVPPEVEITILYQCWLDHMQGEIMAQPCLGLGTGGPWLSLGGPFLSSFAQMGLESSVYWPSCLLCFRFNCLWLWHRSHLKYLFQYLFACSMQIQREKAWEIWSHAVTSGRQRVDKQGAVAQHK